MTFTAGGAGTLCAATLPATSCTTSSALPVATYAITATYDGAGFYAGTTAATALTVKARPLPEVVITSTELVVNASGQTVTVRLSCPAGSCSGLVQPTDPASRARGTVITARGRAGAGTAAATYGVVLASAHYRLAAQSNGTVVLRLTKAGRRVPR